MQNPQSRDRNSRMQTKQHKEEGQYLGIEEDARGMKGSLEPKIAWILNYFFFVFFSVSPRAPLLLLA